MATAGFVLKSQAAWTYQPGMRLPGGTVPMNWSDKPLVGRPQITNCGYPISDIGPSAPRLMPFKVKR